MKIGQTDYSGTTNDVRQSWNKCNFHATRYAVASVKAMPKTIDFGPDPAAPGYLDLKHNDLCFLTLNQFMCRPTHGFYNTNVQCSF